jgi:hypothetical protein
MLEHVVLAFALQALVAMALRSWAAGAAAACAWSISREITQAEYRWIEHYGHGLRADMPWWGGLDLRVWQNVDPWLDWIGPCVAVIAIAVSVTRVLPRLHYWSSRRKPGSQEE